MKVEKTVYTYDKRKQIITMLMGVLIAYAITCIAFIGCALALTYTGITENSVPVIVTVTCIISVTVAGFDAAKGANDKGWLWGLLAGAIYAVILACISTFFVKSFALDTRTITLIILCLAGGGLGGVIGINLRSKNKSR